MGDRAQHIHGKNICPIGSYMRPLTVSNLKCKNLIICPLINNLVIGAFTIVCISITFSKLNLKEYNLWKEFLCITRWGIGFLKVPSKIQACYCKVYCTKKVSAVWMSRLKKLSGWYIISKKVERLNRCHAEAVLNTIVPLNRHDTSTRLTFSFDTSQMQNLFLFFEMVDKKTSNLLIIQGSF